jgi:4-aminobutyrate aminotransferase-like enzyme
LWSRRHERFSFEVQLLWIRYKLAAFHLAGPTLSLEVRKGRAGELVQACEERGVLVSAGAGGRRVGVAPPLTIQPDHLNNALKILKKAAGAL